MSEQNFWDSISARIMMRGHVEEKRKAQRIEEDMLNSFTERGKSRLKVGCSAILRVFFTSLLSLYYYETSLRMFTSFEDAYGPGHHFESSPVPRLDWTPYACANQVLWMTA